MSYFNHSGAVIEISNEVKPTYPVYSRKECHSGTIEVFKDPSTNIPICGGGEYRGVQITTKDLLIDVGIKLDNLIETKNVEGTEKLNEYGSYKIIKISWKDMDDVNLPIEFWLELVNVIRKVKRRTIISCVGGHGRTGTTLSILAYLMLGEKSPVEFVRKHYCSEAVETDSQIEYIEKICGLKLDDSPSKIYYSTYNKPTASYYNSQTVWGKGEESKKEDNIEKEVKTSLDLDPLYPHFLIEEDEIFF